MRNKPRQSNFGYLPFVLPALLLFSLFFFFPMILSMYYSFTNWNGFSQTAKFNGLANFTLMLEDRSLIKALKNTLIICVYSILSFNVLGIGVALLMDLPLRTRGMLRMLLFLPVMLSAVVVGFVMSYIFSWDGAINRFFEWIGMNFLIHDWMGNVRTVLSTIIVTEVWQSFGFHVIIYLAGLQGIPQDYYESAMIDGAKFWRKLWHVTLPLLAPAITINVILSTIRGIKVFDSVLIMTDGGPGYATQTISLRIYKEAFVAQHTGYASAVSLVMFIVIMLISIVQLRFFRRKELQM